MMKPVAPPETVFHLGYGLRVVVNLDVPEANEKAEFLTRKHGDGTWTISLEAHMMAVQEMNLRGRSNIMENPIWIPWNELSIPGEG